MDVRGFRSSAWVDKEGPSHLSMGSVKASNVDEEALKLRNTGWGCQTPGVPLQGSLSPPLRPTFYTMGIIWDAPLAMGVARELDSLLRGSRLRACRFQWEARELSLFFSGLTVEWALHPTRGWVTVHPAWDVPHDARSVAAVCRGVTALPDERVLRFGFTRRRGRTRQAQVVVELMTNQWNALWLEGDDARIRHVLWTRRLSGRTLAVGQRYCFPDSSPRLGVARPLSTQEWTRLVGEEDPGSGGKQLLERVAFTSPLNLPALLEEPTTEDDPRKRPEAGLELWQHLRTLEPLEPCLLEAPGGLQPYPLVLPGFGYRKTATLLEAFHLAAEGADRSPLASGEVMERLERALTQAKRRVRGIQRELDAAPDPQGTRHRADLLLARLGEIPREASEVEIRDFDGSPVTLTLDPARTPQQNAEDLYREAARLERARDRLPPLLEEARSSVRELVRIRRDLQEGKLAPDEAIGRLPPLPVPGRARGSGRDRQPYRRFRSSSGLEIRVGRGSSDNDALTFRHARPDEIWLHARDAAGAHVILRWTGEGSPPARDLTEAAVLAAVHSQARGSGIVPVDWTRRKYVRKPRKAPPGSVLPDRVQTLFVEPDPEIVRRLAWRD